MQVPLTQGMQKGSNPIEATIGLIVGSVIGFASYVYTLFGYTIPSFFAVYFKEIGAALIMMAVFVFAVAWLMKAKPHRKPQKYQVKVYDVCGVETQIDGIRTEFKTHDVAWSHSVQRRDGQGSGIQVWVRLCGGGSMQRLRPMCVGVRQHGEE